MSEPPIPSDDPEALAGEYALRLLGPEEEAACAARVARDPEFAAAVARWEATFAELDAAFAPVAPPARLLGRVEARLFGPEASAPASWPARVWQSAAIWRGLTAAACLAAAALAMAPRPAPMGPGLVASVAPDMVREPGAVKLMAVYDPASNEIRFTKDWGAAAPGRSMELWLLPEGATTPASLGLVPATAGFAVVLPAGLAAEMGPGTRILVSDEVAGGSPTGEMRGTVMASGELTSL